MLELLLEARADVNHFWAIALTFAIRSDNDGVMRPLFEGRLLWVFVLFRWFSGFPFKQRIDHLTVHHGSELAVLSPPQRLFGLTKQPLEFGAKSLLTLLLKHLLAIGWCLCCCFKQHFHPGSTQMKPASHFH